jgi:hypothetical protein
MLKHLSRIALLSLGALLLTLPSLAQEKKDEKKEPSPDLQKALASAAQEVAQFLKSRQAGELAVGQFTSPPQLQASGGSGLSKILAEQLTQSGVTVKRRAELGLQGEYAEVPAQEGAVVARITGEVRDRQGKAVHQFTRDVSGPEAIAGMFGVTVNLPPDKGQKERNRILRKGLGTSQVVLAENKVLAGEGSPYSIEVLVRDGAKLDSRPPKDQEGMAFVSIERGQQYAVRVTNKSEYDAAVTLMIDGLNMFAFSERKDYSYFILGAGQSTVIQGWHRTNEVSDAFEVTSYAKSAVAELLASPAKIGTITATFAAAWAVDQPPPPDELAARLADRGTGDATGRGPAVASKFTEVARKKGAMRASVSVRYTRPE